MDFVDDKGIYGVVIVEHFDGGGGVGSGLVVFCLQDDLFASDEGGGDVIVVEFVVDFEGEEAKGSEVGTGRSGGEGLYGVISFTGVSRA